MQFLWKEETLVAVGDLGGNASVYDISNGSSLVA